MLHNGNGWSAVDFIATKIRCNNNGTNNCINAISATQSFNDLFFWDNNLIMIIQLVFYQKPNSFLMN